MKSLLDKDFKYTPANKTDLKKTFQRVRQEQQKIKQEQKDKVKTQWRQA